MERNAFICQLLVSLVWNHKEASSVQGVSGEVLMHCPFQTFPPLPIIHYHFPKILWWRNQTFLISLRNNREAKTKIRLLQSLCGPCGTSVCELLHNLFYQIRLARQQQGGFINNIFVRTVATQLLGWEAYGLWLKIKLLAELLELSFANKLSDETTTLSDQVFCKEIIYILICSL